MRIKIDMNDEKIKPCYMDIPENHDYVEYANKRRDESGAIGWDAVSEFEVAIRERIAEDMSVGVVPHEEGRS